MQHATQQHVPLHQDGKLVYMVIFMMITTFESQSKRIICKLKFLRNFLKRVRFCAP